MHPHPQCVDGEDEVDCFDQYLERGFVSLSADYVCQSPYHNDESPSPTVNILAVSCDGIPECWKGVDEEGCNLNNSQYAIGTYWISHNNKLFFYETLKSIRWLLP